MTDTPPVDETLGMPLLPMGPRPGRGPSITPHPEVAPAEVQPRAGIHYIIPDSDMPNQQMMPSPQIEPTDEA